MREWALISTHGLVLASIARDGQKTAREIGDEVGVTERTAHKIIIELEKAGYITRTRTGVRNAYEIHPDAPLRNRLSDARLSDLLALFGWHRKKRPGSAKAPESTPGSQQ